MALLAQIEWGARVSNTRTANRRKLSLVARGTTAAQEFATVVIHDLSESGVLIETDVELSPGEPLEIEIQEAGTAAAYVVWNSGRFFGCEFERRLPKAAVSAALLRNAARPPATEIQDTPAANNIEPAVDPLRWPAGVRMGIVLTLAAASWAVIGLIAWAAVAAGA